MSNLSYALRSSRVVFENTIQSGVVLISDRKIQGFSSKGEFPSDYELVDCGTNVVMPGLIDPHVHINEPGRTEWEGFETATKAAAAGGITTMIEMPLNASPVTTTQENFTLKMKAAKGKLYVNCGFWGGVVPDNLNQLEALLKSGVFGLKAFLTHSGIDEFPNTNADQLEFALQILKKFDLPLLVHCELESANDQAYLLKENPKSYKAYLASRPKKWENDAVKLMIDLCRKTNARVHIVHVSSAEALPLIRNAKAEGLPITAETCPQYLFFAAEDIPDGDTRFKCAPPIRERANNELLWEALKEGTLDFIASDHSPAPPEIKEISSGDFSKAWGGIAGLQFTLPIIWTAARKRGFSEMDIYKWLSFNPSKIAGLEKKKGKIEAGYDADLVVWNPEKLIEISEDRIFHRHKITPYAGLELVGTVERTMVDGRFVLNDGQFSSDHNGHIIKSSK